MKPRFYADPDLRALDARLTALEDRLEALNGRLLPEVDTRAPNYTDPTTAEVAAELRPDAYAIKHLNYGWYEVVDSEGLPIHKGKLRKPQALDLMKEKGEGA